MLDSQEGHKSFLRKHFKFITELREKSTTSLAVDENYIHQSLSQSWLWENYVSGVNASQVFKTVKEKLKKSNTLTSMRIGSHGFFLFCNL